MDKFWYNVLCSGSLCCLLSLLFHRTKALEIDWHIFCTISSLRFQLNLLRVLSSLLNFHHTIFGRRKYSAVFCYFILFFSSEVEAFFKSIAFHLSYYSKWDGGSGENQCYCSPFSLPAFIGRGDFIKVKGH